VTLRTRLLLAATVIVVVVVLGAAALLRTQRDYLVDQVDAQLEATRPLLQAGPPVAAPVAPSTPRDGPISTLFIGYLESGDVVAVLQGQLLDDVPDLDDVAADTLTDGDTFTVDGAEGSTRFRVAVVRTVGEDRVAVVALPLDEVDSAVGRLRWALGAGSAAIVAVLALVVWWVERHGLRPVARLTEAAAAIARGERGHRVAVADPRTEAGHLASAFNVMLDERDATEEGLRRFVADASHELRTPLTSIRGYLDLYQEGGFREPGALDDMVRRMRQESSRMHDLVEDLLLLANLDQHRPLRRETVDLERLVRDAATDAQVLQPDRPIVVDVQGDEPVETVGDTFRLQQVVGALVSNALAYTDHNVLLRLTAATTPSGIRVTVEDTGPGLAAHDAARVFDRFFRGELSRSRRSGGSGLGLAIAHAIVEAHDGTITLDTVPGRGCRFVITLPSTRPAQHPLAQRSLPSVPSALPRDASNRG
jgi:two-component system, OmpR family, sensor kinase